MSKQVTKSETTKPKATEALTAIVEAALAFRADERLNLATLARLANRGSGLLRLQDVDERISIENATTVALAKKLGLVS